MLAFLLQGLISVARVFEPPSKIIERYGAGVWTAPRVALLMHHTEIMPQESADRMNCVGRSLFGRALTEYEQSKLTSNAEGPEDAGSQAQEALLNCQKFVTDFCMIKFQENEWPIPTQNTSYWDFDKHDEFKALLVEHLYAHGFKRNQLMALAWQCLQERPPEDFGAAGVTRRSEVQSETTAKKTLEDTTSTEKPSEAEIKAHCENFVDKFCMIKFVTKDWSMLNQCGAYWEFKHLQELKDLLNQKGSMWGVKQKELLEFSWNYLRLRPLEAFSNAPTPAPKAEPLPSMHSTPAATSSTAATSSPAAAPLKAATRQEVPIAATSSTSQDDEAKAIERMAEESYCREALDKMDWGEYVPDSQTSLQSLGELGVLVEDYLKQFSNVTLHKLGKQCALPQSIRVWLAVTRHALELMASRGWSPKFLSEVHDKYIRQFAGAAPEMWNDPGNSKPSTPNPPISNPKPELSSPSTLLYSLYIYICISSF